MSYTPFDLTGQVALVTGGNSGIGLGFAKAVAQAGADVAIWGTNADKNAAAKAALSATGRRIETFVCDVGDEAAVEVWQTDSLELVWERDAWRIADQSSSPGPVPSRGGGSVVTTAADFERRLAGFKAEGSS